jgi:hypothetical protein
MTLNPVQQLWALAIWKYRKVFSTKLSFHIFLIQFLFFLILKSSNSSVHSMVHSVFF